jgi:hypothetical protein
MRRRFFGYLHTVTAPGRDSVALWDVVEIALVALGFLLYFLVRGAVVDRTAEAFDNARWIIDLQASLGLWVEPAVNRWTLESDALIRLFNFAYFWLDFPLIVAVGLLLFWRRRDVYTLLRDALLISGGLALVLYWSFPVAPPRFLTEWGFVDTLEQYSNLAYQTQSTAPFVNPFAALPSLHVGWSLLLVIAAFIATPSWLYRGAMIVVLVLQSVAVVGTANHYIFDGVVGAVVSLAGLAFAIQLQRRGYPAIHAWLGARVSREPVGVDAS